ncbi:uncharacterized protein LOC116344415 [Contarinia nasturtii]|uniref:uncharacterized protein LOC116344415 n=1 Tax=Contarinia nasturtii TaxID=265458 RepID=UPI0012D4A58B|nr:uncharacterized protein LOC116344415 [Contarinia nasturtii]
MKTPPIEASPVQCTSGTKSDDDDFIIFEDDSPKEVRIGRFIKVKPNIVKNRYNRKLFETKDDFISFEDDIETCFKRYVSSDDESDDKSVIETAKNSEIVTKVDKKDDKTTRPDSGFIEKKVTFNLRPTVHEMRVWQFAYSEARKSIWEQVGRDRVRFQARINKLSNKLTPILNAAFRQKIYEQRFHDEQ